MKLLKNQLMDKSDLVSLSHVNELIKGINKKNEIEEESKKNTWIVILVIALGLVIAGLVVYKVFFAGDDFDDFDDFDDDFEDIEFDDDYDDFDDYDEDFEDEIDEMIDSVVDDEDEE